MRYRHLFFDLDHTLWDFETASRITWERLYAEWGLAERGITAFEPFFAAYNRHNDAMWERFRAGTLSREDLRWKRIRNALVDLKVYDEKLARALSEAYLELLPAQAVLMPSAKELLDHCTARGYVLHLITNGFETTQRRKLEHAGIGHYFREIITSESSGYPKPHPQIFAYALQCAGAGCTECLMVGDALDIDVLGAMAAGIDTVYYNPACKPHSEKPTYEIAHLRELIGIL